MYKRQQNIESQSLRDPNQEHSDSNELFGKRTKTEHGAASALEKAGDGENLDVLNRVKSSNPKSINQAQKEKGDMRLSPSSSINISSSALAEALLDRLDLSD